MARVPELTEGPIPLAPEVGLLLGKLAAHLDRGTSVTIDPALLRQAEAEVRSVIPFEVMAILAIERRLPAALEDWTTGIRAFYEAEGPEVLRALELDHVAFAQLVGTPEDWTAEPCFAMFKRVTERNSAAQLVRWDVRKPGRGGERYSLSRYLEERWGVSGAASSPVQVVLASPPLAPDEYVLHRTFGRGRVLSRAQGKVTVAFEDGATRTLVESFVRPVS